MMTYEKDVLTEGLADIRRHIENLNLATAAYATIGISDEEYIISIIDGDTAITLKTKAKKSDRHEEILNWLRTYTSNNNLKIIAATLTGTTDLYQLGSRLWLEDDIVPYILEDERDISEAKIQDIAYHTCTKFDANNLVDVPITDSGEVQIAYLVTEDEYKKTVEKKAWQYFEKLVREFKKKKNHLLFINATPQGGGVALMRHALMRLYQLLDVDIHWHVLQPNREVFEITKTKFHNVLQAVAPEGIELTEQDQHIYRSWSKENAEHLRPSIEEAKVIVIDDPQPSGLVPFITEYNPNAKILYRSHIHLDNQLLAKEGSPQYNTWKFIWGNAQAAEVFISHPVKKFIPEDVIDRTVTMPATTDPLDGLNKPLSPHQLHYYLNLFNKILLEHDQEPLDQERPYIIQIARFDPSKGIPDVIESYRILRDKLDNKQPQLVIVGHGSIDDPDGIPIYNMIIHLLQSKKYQHLAKDVKVVRLHHNDQILNALLRGSHAALQLSLKEGFEVKVTEALHKGKPVVAYQTGGIPLQIKHGETGFLVEVGKTETVAEHLFQLFTDSTLYESMSEQARKTLNPNYFTVYNAIKWLYLANQIIGNGVQIEETCPTVQSLIGEASIPTKAGSL